MYNDVILAKPQHMSTAAMEMYSKTLQGAMRKWALWLRRSSRPKKVVLGIIAHDAKETMSHNTSD